MTWAIDDRAVEAIVGHMNGDHAGDNLVIVRGHGFPEAMSARFTGFDAIEARFAIITASGDVREVTVPWLHAPVLERSEVRREVVALFVAAGGRQDPSASSDAH